MAPGPRVVLLLLAPLRFWLLVSAAELEMIDRDAPELTCSEVLTDCRISSGSQFSAALPDPYGPLDVTQLQLRVALCCSSGRDCTPCLRIIITLREVDGVQEASGESGDDPDEGAVVRVCLSSPAPRGGCKALQFKVSSSGLSPEPSSHQLLLTEEVDFGVPVLVFVQSKKTLDQNITVPSLETVCTMNPGGSIQDCDVPRLRAVTDGDRDVVRLQLENSESRPNDLLWQMFWNEKPGEVQIWPKDQTEMVISSDLVAPCLCFQVWVKGKARGRSCPFTNQPDALERMQHSVSVSVVESQTRSGRTGLSWEVTAPCRLEAELWLCTRGQARGQCEEVTGSRQRLRASSWITAQRGHRHTGEFNASSHPLLCVQIKIKGAESHSEPQCPFTASRSRWSLLLLVGSLLLCVTVLGAYFIRGILKGYMWRWLKDEDVKGAVGGGHVVLLYPPDEDQGLPGLLCHLGSSLQALGFSVSLDLWSRAELCMLGPVPWLHSQLDRLQRQGGKVVLILTQTTWTRAEEWGARSWERNRQRSRELQEEEEEEEEQEEGGRRSPASSHSVDVFGASLSCVLADYLQGRAGQRFMLVQFESRPPEPAGSFRPLPQLFHGLHVYSLPSQSLGFLTELAGAQRAATASARRRRAGGLRVASRALARRLSGFTAGTNVLHLAGVSPSCVAAGAEDSGETVPLQPGLITPPSSPDTHPKTSEMDWV